jgi:Histidine kinase-, DNA gyrase B-, and HSP90-like ATPase
MTHAIEKLAEKRRKWVEANRENGFDVGLKRLLTDLYPDNAHFIYELLQNAEDADAQTVRFILQEDRIEFEHDGKKLFKIENVDAITSIGFSTKRDDATSIGKFGVGFKAVFAYTETPQIESGDVHFRIRDMVVPEPDIFSRRSQTGGMQTRFILPFDNPKNSALRP